MKRGTAFLSSYGEYTTFTFNDRTITFLTGKNLERYTRIKEWDKGYIVVMCKTKNHPAAEQEDYIDLVPILENLYINPETFLKPIEQVDVNYA